MLFRQWTGQVWMFATAEGYWNDRSSIPDNRSGLETENKDWTSMMDSLLVWINKANIYQKKMKSQWKGHSLYDAQKPALVSVWVQLHTW